MSDWPVAWRWAALLALSLLCMGALELIRIPAALLLGPMVGAVVMATRGAPVRIARPVFYLAQGCIGVMIASNLPAAVFPDIAARWPIFLLSTLSTLVAAAAMGWSLARSGLLPGTTAIWGSSPGAATAMTLMSESYGADMRLVAFMQYLRVACCASIAALVARFFGTPVAAHDAPSAVFDAGGFALTLAIIVAGSFAGIKAKVPAGAMLVPMVVGMAVKLTGLGQLVLPTPFLALCYGVIGWGIGNRFTPDVVVYAARAFPRVLGGILALIAVCAGVAAVLVRVAGVDPLTAYLATSPGGADSVSIIATATQVDIPFVIAMQVARFFLVILTGPLLARRLSGPARAL